MIKFLKIAVVACMMLAPVACTKQLEIVEPQSTESSPTSLVSAKVEAVNEVVYTTTPALNTWTVATSGSTLNLSCAKYYPGLRAKVIAQSGNKFTVQIQRNDGKPFNGTGIGYIKATDLCSTIAGSTTFTDKNYYYLNIDFWATFQTGSVVFQPTITINNVRYYANPITVTAKSISPTFPITTMKNGTNSSSGNTYCISPTNVFAPSNIGQCTWYVYGRIQELVANGYLSQTSGNVLRNAFSGKNGRDAIKWPSFIGGTWYNTSASTPLDISKRKKGMIVVWDNVMSLGQKTGHVGFVEEVSADKQTFRVSEFNMSPLKYSEKSLRFDTQRNLGSGKSNASFYDLDILK